jgi:SAM-dependent methyltransferase
MRFPVVLPASQLSVTSIPGTSPRNLPEVPKIFELVKVGSVANGFWGYYEVDSWNASVNPQASLVRFISAISSFVRPTGSLLSVGCGYGLNEILLSFLCPDVEVVGVDILDDLKTDAKIRSMKEIARQVQSGRVTPLLADGGRLPFRDETFDCAMAIDSVSHADYDREDCDLEESQELLLEDMSRVVRPGGRLAVIDTNAISPRNVMRKSGSSCHPVNPFFLRSVLRRLGYERVRIAPHYDLTLRRNASARFVGAVLRHSSAFGLLLSPWFMLRAQKGT